MYKQIAMETRNRINWCDEICKHMTSSPATGKTSEPFKSRDLNMQYEQSASLAVVDVSRCCSHQVQESRHYSSSLEIVYRRDTLQCRELATAKDNEMSCPAEHNGRLTSDDGIGERRSNAQCILCLRERDIGECSYSRNVKSGNTWVSTDYSGFKYLVNNRSNNSNNNGRLATTCECKRVRKFAMTDRSCDDDDDDCCGRTNVSKRVKCAKLHCRHGAVKDSSSRRELSMLTVLLALLAIARGKCLLLSTPLARSSLTAVALACVLLVGVLVPATTAQLSPHNMDTSASFNDGVCESVDIRNSVAGFDALKGCRVVEGFVQILLIDHATEADYANISFPELREITDYLLLYRATGLRSLGKIFPNLAVIRGSTLFVNYAVVSYEMLDLQEIGLHSLTDIARGSVRIEKNPLLCYADTIDWDDAIVKQAGRSANVIKGNRMKNECPMCPTLTNDKTCPVSTQEHNKGEPLCWNRHKCQKICPKECSSCDDNGECCDENCLGGCKIGPRSPENCYVCKNLMFEGKCIKKCPHGTFEYLKRRCVQEKECYKMPVSKSERNIPANTTWKTFDSLCILRCPPGYEEKLDNKNFLRCFICKGPCRKECPGTNINSIADAQTLKDCTYILGSLEIQITGGKNIVKELEDNLNMIEEIYGHLKIVRSVPLISLNFLKKLRIIHGNILESNKSALVVIDNENLQELWDWDTRGVSLQIKKGRLFFHFNSKLCLYKIERLSNEARLTSFTDLEVGASNGDKIPCNVTELHVTVKATAYVAVLEWRKFQHHDQRQLLGYNVYFIEAPHNLSLYDRRDACGSDGWIVDDVDPVEHPIHLLSHLKPYTRYAFYVKTFMITNVNSGAQSPIQYFRTSPSVPSVPQMLKVLTNSSTELVIKWQPPINPNGNITHYVVTATQESDDQTYLGERNYCLEPISHHDTKAIQLVPEQEEKTTSSTCVCDKLDKPSLKDTSEQKEQSIDFEDSLHNQIYFKASPETLSKRRRRSIDNTASSVNFMSSDASYPATPSNLTEDHSFTQTVYNTTTVVISQLRHYGRYRINVQACRELTPKESKVGTVENCSTTSFEIARTLHLVGADDVPQLNVEMKNDSLGSVKLMWDEPVQPNGLIVTYQIEYSRMDIENFKPTVECITRRQYLHYGKSYTLKKLLPGNYSVHVRATSLYGDGEYTPKLYFLIKDGSSTSGIEWVIAFVSLFSVFVIGVLAYIIRRKNMPGVPNMKLIASVNPEYMSTVYVPDEWEVPRKKIELLRELGQGSFGMVYEGIGRDIADHEPEIRCAIKTVGEHATDRERSEFLNEASVMKAFHTHHVVQLLGVVSQGQPVLVVMELMTHGDLKTYLRSHRPDTGGDQSIQPPTLRRILQMAIEIADGMAYLAAKKFVHRDLAARNCMVAEDLTVKIGDFGMTRDIYETDYYRKGTKGLLPVRWMAPESLKDGVFTSRSDVWSYGVVLWEMATLASQPYQGLSNDQVLRYVIDGGVMERPENCPDRLYELMRLCWQHKPLARPPFLDLVAILLADVGPDFSQVSFYHSKEGCEVRAHLAEVPASLIEDDPATPLRVTRDIEDFSLGGSDDEDPFEVTAHSPSTSYPRFGSVVASTQPPLLLGNDQVVVSLSSNGNKLGNGSTVTPPTAPNGWIANHQNGTDIASNVSLKTTEC